MQREKSFYRQDAGGAGPVLFPRISLKHAAYNLLFGWLVSIVEKQVSVRWPLQGWIGLLLLAVFWPLNWLLSGMRTAYLFFPLWLGYILVIDALVERRSGTSLLNR